MPGSAHFDPPTTVPGAGVAGGFSDNPRRRIIWRLLGRRSQNRGRQLLLPERLGPVTLLSNRQLLLDLRSRQRLGLEEDA
jgi:hypothetical protein